MGFEYIEQELELKIKDKVYKFREPSAYEQKQISKKFREADENTDAVDLYLDFFAQLGLSREIIGNLSFQGLIDLFSYSVSTKKN